MKVGRPKKLDKAQPSDRIKCSVCGLIYTRSGKTLHYRTRIHQIYEDIENKKEEENEEENQVPISVKNYIVDMYGQVYLRDRDLKYLNNPKVSYTKKISYIDNIVNGS